MAKFEIIKADELRAGNFDVDGILIHEFKDVLRLIDKQVKIAQIEGKNRCCVQIPKRYFNIEKYNKKIMGVLNEAGYSVDMKFCTQVKTYITNLSW